MTNLKCMLYILCVFFLKNTEAQDYKQFFIEIQDEDLVPEVSHTYDGVKINSTRTIYKELNNIFNLYEIYSSEKVFKSSQKASLQNIYLIKCNDLELMNELYANYRNYYPRVEDANVEPLTLPDDFGVFGGYTSVDQDELTYIRGPEAWDITTGSSDVIIGISDNNVQPLHEDFVGKIQHVFGNNYPDSSSSQHGSFVSSVASANTNNNLGMSAIGYDSSIYSATNNWVNGVDTLSLMPGVKVINTAWISSAMPEMYNEIVEDRGIVVVASAGNAQPNADAYINPAAFKNVISVSAIGHHTASFYRGSNFWEVVEDSHEIKLNGEVFVFQHNDSVDIVAPAYGILLADPRFGLDTYLDNGIGTSYASPMVSGTIALMFSVNYCIDPKEVESILKLTAVKIDDLPANLQYSGKLGAGKLDAYEAVKMAKDMADEFGTVEVKDRVLYRWFYKLETAPYEIKMINNDVTGNARLKFKARNNIEILSGDYYPESGGYIDLSIDENLVLDDCPPPSSTSSRISSKSVKKIEDIRNKLKLYPNPTNGNINVSLEEDYLDEIIITSLAGVKLIQINNLKETSCKIDLNSLKRGFYVANVLLKSGERYVKIVVKN